jgi:hypothetical protein
VALASLEFIWLTLVGESYCFSLIREGKVIIGESWGP